MNYEEKLESMGYKLPTQVNKRIFEAGVQTGNLIFVSGNAAKVDGILKYKGIVGEGISVEQAQDAAEIAFVNCLASVRNLTGSLNCIKKIVNVKGYVASTSDFIGATRSYGRGLYWRMKYLVKWGNTVGFRWGHLHFQEEHLLN